VRSGCTVVLGSGVNFDAELVSMTFAGPLTVQSSQQAEVHFVKSRFAAPSITFNLAGAGSALATVESTLQASRGSLLITLGNEGKMDIIARQLQGPKHGSPRPRAFRSVAVRSSSA
jgi:hypothetical protein